VEKGLILCSNSFYVVDRKEVNVVMFVVVVYLVLCFVEYYF
jgi:hypothetical protein